MIGVNSAFMIDRLIARPVDDRLDVALPCARMPAISTTTNVMIASIAVTEMLPVAVDAVWNEAEQVGEQDEEEEREQEWHVCFAVVTDVRENHFLPDVEHDRFDAVGESFRLSALGVLSHVRLCSDEQRDEAENARRRAA